MAKAKKSETAPKAPAKASAAKPASKAAAKSKPAAPGTPMVDTNLAAQTAARMIGAKASGMSSTASGGEKKETSAFKQMKQALAKPHAASVGNLLNSTLSPGAKKSNLPFHGGKQVGHNQTFGSDASRNLVPRRTGG